ncbi:MAG TPA: ATP-dependent helicase [Deltaproteobacteria bacterium]|nr:ATP-dependent helicase [Deltaproteobacteria bacterium]
MDLSSLNENQKRAVEWGEGPLLVLAGPGSGKTRVLTYRIARLIESSPQQRYKILGLTFTNKAAAEMRDRVEHMIPEASTRILLSTFHSFCADLLRQHGHHLGLRPDFTILSDSADQEAVLESAISQCGARENYSPGKLLPMITRLLDLNVSPEDASSVLEKLGAKGASNLAGIYKAYRSFLIDNNQLDFGSLIAEAIVLLENHKGIRKQLLRIFPFVCVDEFQDTNLSQFLVLRQLVNPETKNLFIVADDDQIIYQWNGASPKRLQELKDEFKMTVIQLPENYRCPPEVIEIANSLISNNLGRSADKELLKAHKVSTGSGSLRVKLFSSLEEEAKWVAEDIASRSKVERQKCAILARTRKVLDYFIPALKASGLNGYLSIRKNEFVTPQFRWLHSILRLANARQDKEQLRRVCKAFFALEGINLDVKDIVSLASSGEGDFLRAWAISASKRFEISGITTKLLDETMEKLADRLDFRSFVDAAFHWFKNIDLTPQDPNFDDQEYNSEKDTWRRLTSEIDSQYGKENVSLHSFLQEFDLRSKEPPPPPEGIPCFTIHASKGMEFGHVFLVAIVEDQLPSWAAKKKGDDSHEMQEERRNCFVAITRAQQSLTITYSNRVFGWNKEPSRFLFEMGLIQ